MKINMPYVGQHIKLLYLIHRLRKLDGSLTINIEEYKNISVNKVSNINNVTRIRCSFNNPNCRYKSYNTRTNKNTNIHCVSTNGTTLHYNDILYFN